QVPYDGEVKPVYVIDYMMDLMGGLKTTEWLGHDGTTYQVEIGLMGLKMVLAKTDMQTALGEVGEVDVIINTKIFAQGPPLIGNAPHFKARLRLTEGELKKAIIVDDRQKLTVDSDPRRGTLEIKTPIVDATKAPNLPIQSRDGNEVLDQFLKSTVYIQADHPALRAKATEIINGETNAWKAAEKLCRWVHESIHDKNLKIGFGSATQTLASLEGDCTEHTVLLIALARSVGIPARVCAGLVFQRDAFYYHFWPEVYVGKWVAMEPTLGQIQADATHIQLAGSQLESDTMLEFGEGVMRTLNQLEIEVIE
ncbi:transglutaminase domain-containing protein, partial [Candidatus Poribacteria bacterium]|nr:transglutaminase domain-containing protein [Candidatus Poribacteria bacterium]